MGETASYIWKENDEITIYYTSKGSYQTTNVLAQGFEFCKEYFPKLTVADRILYPDDTYGVLLIDVDAKHIIVFSCDDYPPTIKNFYLEKVKRIWPKWTINYTNYGMEDVYAHLKMERDYELLECDYSFEGINNDPELPEMIYTDLDYLNYVTIVRNKKHHHYQLGHVPCVNIALSKGEDAYKWFNKKHLVKKWIKEDDCYETLLIDYNTKSIFVNWANVEPKCAINVIEQKWPGWNVKRQNEGMIFNFKYLKLDYSNLQISESDFEELYRERTMGREHIRAPDKKPYIAKSQHQSNDNGCSIIIDSMSIINKVHQQYFGRNIEEEE